MSARDERVEKIHAAARSHPLVLAALNGLEDDAETFAPSATLEETLVERLKKLEGPDALLSATVGLADLAYLLEEKHNAFEAAEVIRSSLAQVQKQINAAVATLPAGSDLGAKLLDGFGEKKAEQKGAVLQPKQAHVASAGFDLGAPPAKKK